VIKREKCDRVEAGSDEGRVVIDRQPAKDRARCPRDTSSVQPGGDREYPPAKCRLRLEVRGYAGRGRG